MNHYQPKPRYCFCHKDTYNIGKMVRRHFNAYAYRVKKKEETYTVEHNGQVIMNPEEIITVMQQLLLFRTMRSRDHEVVVVRRTINLDTGNLEWGGNWEGLRKGRSVYE
jgi:hypothetical protein